MRHLDFYLPCWLLHIMLQCSEAGEENKGFVFLSLWRLGGWFFRFDNANKILVIWCCKNTRSMPACYFSSNNLVTFIFNKTNKHMEIIYCEMLENTELDNFIISTQATFAFSTNPFFLLSKLRRGRKGVRESKIFNWIFCFKFWLMLLHI